MPGTFLRLQEQGKLTDDALRKLEAAKKEDLLDFLDDDDCSSEDTDNDAENLAEVVTRSNVCDTGIKDETLTEISGTIGVNQELRAMNLDDKGVTELANDGSNEDIENI